MLKTKIISLIYLKNVKRYQINLKSFDFRRVLLCTVEHWQILFIKLPMSYNMPIYVLYVLLYIATACHSMNTILYSANISNLQLLWKWMRLIDTLMYKWGKISLTTWLKKINDVKEVRNKLKKNMFSIIMSHLVK